MRATAGAVPFTTAAEINAALPGAAAHLLAGRVLAYPTETVYGFGSSIQNNGLAALRAIKSRDAGKPFLLLIADIAMLDSLGMALHGVSARFAARFWPGPLTLILSGGTPVDPALRGPRGEVAVRLTSHPGAQRLLQALGAPMTSTSANRAGLPPARTAQEIVAQWAPDVARGELLVLDGGRQANVEPSAIVDCVGVVPRLVRKGAISGAALREIVPELVGEG